jgi:hypothetical protein
MPNVESWTFIPLGRNRSKGWVLVDAADAEWLKSWIWTRGSGHSGDYAQRTVKLPNGKQLSIRMHRLVAGLQPGDKRQVDHRNHDTLDNRRCNLRVVTHAQNQHNRQDIARGVSWSKQKQKWRARVGMDGKEHHVGFFASREVAIEAAAAWRAEHMPFSQEASAA